MPTNDFLNKVDLPSSDKFYMVRMQCGKIFTRENTTDVGLFTHPITSGPFIVFTSTIAKNLCMKELVARSSNSVPELNGVFTRIPTDTFPNSLGVATGYKTYFYDPDTGIIKFAFSDYDGSPVPFPTYMELVLEYYVFFTQFTGKRAFSEMNGGGENVYWSPRISKDASFAFSQSNNIMSSLEISASSIEFKNNDLFFNDFLGTHDTFNNREVKVWRCIDSVDNNQVEFVGVIKSAYIDDEKFSIELHDITSKLDEIYYVDDPATTPDRITYADLQNSGTGYIIREQDMNLPVYKIFGTSGPRSVEINTPYTYINSEKSLPAVCAIYNPTKTTSTNRYWSCGIGPSSVLYGALTVTAHASYSTGGFTYSKLTVSTNPCAVLAVGDIFKLGAYYCLVRSVTGVDAGGAANEILVYPYNASLSTGILDREKVSAVIIEQGDAKYYPVMYRDYVSLIGPMGDIQILFSNNFEANHSGLTLLDPDSARIFTVAWTDNAGAYKASEVVQMALEYAGLEVSTNFLPAYSGWPDPNLCFSIPFSGDSSYPTVREVVDKCLKSALAFIYTDNNGEFRYKSFLDKRDDVDLVNQSSQDIDDEINQSNSSGFSVSLDLFDQYASVDFEFSHCMLGSYNTSKIKNSRANLFYKTNRTYEVETILDTNNNYNLGPSVTSFLTLYTNLITGRRANYKLSVFSRHFKLFIGDDILTSRVKMVGGVNSEYLRVMSVSKDINESALSLIDVKSFPIE